MDDVDDDEGEVLEDEFKPVASNLTKFGRPGTRRAACEWFKQTQTEYVLDQSASKFADWFHGIISRKYVIDNFF